MQERKSDEPEEETKDNGSFSGVRHGPKELPEQRQPSSQNGLKPED